MDFKLGNSVIPVDKKLDAFNSLYKMYIEFALISAESLEKHLAKKYDPNTVWEKFVENMDGLLHIGADYSCKLLFSLGIHGVTEAGFLSKYYDCYLNPDLYLRPIAEQLEKLEHFEQLRKMGRELRKMTRTRWSGGGFTFAGVIGSAVASSVINTTSGMLHSIGNAIGNASDKVQVQKIKAEIFGSPNMYKELCTITYVYALQFFYAFRDELETLSGSIQPDFSPDEAQAVFENAAKYATNHEQRVELMAESIKLFPYNDNVYSTLAVICPNSLEVQQIAEYFGMDRVCQFFEKLNRTVRKKEIEQLPEGTLAEKCTKICTWLEFKGLYNEQHRDLTRIPEQIILDVSGNLNTVNDAINYIQVHFSSDTWDGWGKLLVSLDIRRQLIEQDLSRKAIEQITTKTVKDMRLKIGELVAFSKKYGTDETEDIVHILRNFGPTCDDISSCHFVCEKLKELQTDSYPQIALVADALMQKAKMLELEKSCKLANRFCSREHIFLYSPCILDVIQSARESNPVYQLWLIKSFLPDEMIKHSVGYKKMQYLPVPDDLIDIFSNTIALLFNHPEKYSFDLFMRFRATFWTEDVDFMADTLQQFAHSKDCPAGQFEYGKYKLLVSPEDTSAIKAIQQAAKKFYYPAVAYLQDCNCDIDRDPMYYEIIAERGHSCQALYDFKYDSDHRAMKWVVFYKLFTGLLNGEVSPVRNEIKELSNGLHAIWKEINPIDIKYSNKSFGFAGVGRENDVAIKKIKRKLRIQLEDEEVIFAFSRDLPSENLSESILVTTKNLYWSTEKGSYQISHDKMVVVEPENEIFTRFLGDGSLLWLLYSISYYSCVPYNRSCDELHLQKMAISGNPYAISHLLSNDDIGKDLRTEWEKQKQKWEANGQCYRVCPMCYEHRAIDDIFCPECGTKVN